MTTQRNGNRASGATSLLVLPVAAGAVLGKLSDSSLISALILLMEPLIWLAVIYACFMLVMNKRVRLALLFSLSSGAGLALLHFPFSPLIRDVPALTPWNEEVEEAVDCVEPPGDSLVPIRILQWTLTPDSPLKLTADELYRMQPDLLILSGLSSPAIADKVAALLDGEAQHIAPKHDLGGTSLVVRGRFLSCNTSHSIWPLLPIDETAGVYLFWADFIEAGPTPVVVAQTHGPGPLRELSDWYERLGQVQGEASRLIATLDRPRTLFLGNIAAPRSFQSLSTHVEELGLTEALLPASWPTQIGPIPLPGLHPLDRLWVGPAWIPSQSQRIRVDGQPRALIQSDLRTRTPLVDEASDSAHAISDR